ELYKSFVNNNFHSLESKNSILTLCYSGACEKFDGQQFTPVFQSTSMKQVFYDEEGFWWAADDIKGIASDHGSINGSISPNGPFSNELTKINYVNGQITVSSGGFLPLSGALGRSDGVYIYDEGQWFNYNSSKGLNYPKDIMNFFYNPVDQKTSLISFGQGMYNLEQDYFLSRRTSTTFGSNAKLTDALSFWGKNLWITQFDTAYSLHHLAENGLWETKDLISPNANFPMEIKGLNQQLWIRIAPEKGGGIIVFDPSTGAERYLTDVDNNGNLPSQNVWAMAPDKEGIMWVGTDNGVCFFYPINPNNTENVNAQIPYYEYRPLLRGVKILSIKVDAGNRKWFGTNKGLWLFSSDGEELLYQFNTQNSPLVSDNITSLEIDPKTGELFVGTDRGIVSFRTEAVSPENRLSKITIFPNPVSPEYTGNVGFTGFTQETNVKITDIAGQLIWEGISVGGGLSWDRRNLQGDEVSTGVYLVFAVSQNEQEVLVGKIAVVR
ncbi:MAG: hypothetical protein OEY34_07180, partial [Cyclobacteriaceae bacterium]|nr:hypothetical protein [Cyclobacteriaceae bacterium]